MFLDVEIWMKYETNYLEKFTNVYYQASCNWLNISPLIIMKHLKTTGLIFCENSEERVIGMLGYTHSQSWFMTCWVIVAYKGAAFFTFYGF